MIYDCFVVKFVDKVCSLCVGDLVIGDVGFGLLINVV